MYLSVLEIPLLFFIFAKSNRFEGAYGFQRKFFFLSLITRHIILGAFFAFADSLPNTSVLIGAEAYFLKFYQSRTQLFKVASLAFKI